MTATCRQILPARPRRISQMEPLTSRRAKYPQQARRRRRQRSRFWADEKAARSPRRTRREIFDALGADCPLPRDDQRIVIGRYQRGAALGDDFLCDRRAILSVAV